MDDESTIYEVKHICEVCKAHNKNYKCPKCGVGSCSLACCKKHKLQSGCNGIRNKSDFVPSAELKEKHLKTDYHFLEDVLQSKASAKRLATEIKANTSPYVRNSRKVEYQQTSPLISLLQSASLPSSSSSSSATKGALPCNQSLLRQDLSQHSVSIKKLVKAAEDRQTKLILMPPGMTRRSMNTTRFHYKSNKIFWKVHFVFIVSPCDTPQSVSEVHGDHNKELHLPHGPTGSTVSTVMQQVDEETTVLCLLSHLLDSQSDPSLSLLRHALRPIRQKRQRLRCLLQRLPGQANDPRFTEVSLEMSLKDCLKDKVVIEYPTLYIGPAEYTCILNTLITEIHDSTRDEEIEVISNNTLQEKMIMVNNTGDVPSVVMKLSGKRRIEELQPEGDAASDDDDHDEPLEETDDAFITTLKALEGQDIETLKAIIATESDADIDILVDK